MSARRGRLAPPVETAAVLALGLAAIGLALAPLDFAGGATPGPDLVFCLVIAWVVRRPASAPLWAVVALGLAADLFLSRPLGLGALGLLLAAEATRGSAGTLAAGSFAGEWLTASVLCLAAVLGAHVALELAFADGPALAPLLRHAGVTALAYPFVAAVLAVGLGMRGPRRAPAGDRLGRIS